MKSLWIAAATLAITASSALAQSNEDPVVSACRSTGLIALEQYSKNITDLFIDPESLAVTAADTNVEDVPVKTVILGDAYIKRGSKTGKPDRFVCLIGDKGKVLLTFFTAK
jgi:hypothetical protein